MVMVLSRNSYTYIHYSSHLYHMTCCHNSALSNMCGSLVVHGSIPYLVNHDGRFGGEHRQTNQTFAKL
jgi:hypothetical protein